MGIFNKFKKEKKAAQAEIKETAPLKVADQPKTAANLAPVESEEKKIEKEKLGKNKKLITGILIKPLITEKATNLTRFNQYAFAVDLRANKIQIAQAIESRYGVKPVKINIIKNLGKTVRYGRSLGTTKNTKKAIATLPEGKTIKIHEGV